MNYVIPNETQAATTATTIDGLLGQAYQGQITGGLPFSNIPYPTYPSGISETHTKHVHIDLGLIDWKDITIIKGNQKITMTPEGLAIKLGLEW